MTNVGAVLVPLSPLFGCGSAMVAGIGSIRNLITFVPSIPNLSGHARHVFQWMVKFSCG